MAVFCFPRRRSFSIFKVIIFTGIIYFLIDFGFKQKFHLELGEHLDRNQIENAGAVKFFGERKKNDDPTGLDPWGRMIMNKFMDKVLGTQNPREKDNESFLDFDDDEKDVVNIKTSSKLGPYFI